MKKTRVVRFRVSEYQKRKLYVLGRNYPGGFSEFLRRVIDSVDVDETYPEEVKGRSMPTLAISYLN